MTHTRPQVEPDGRYTVQQAAKALGVERHTIYRYFDNGSLKFRVRKADNRRVTTGKWIIECWDENYL